MMASKEEMLKELRAERFPENCGETYRILNFGRHKYFSLKDARRLLKDLNDQEFLDCVNFLQQAGYILVRLQGTERIVDLGDYPFEDLEVKYSEKGIRFARGDFEDPMIDY